MYSWKWKQKIFYCWPDCLLLYCHLHFLGQHRKKEKEDAALRAVPARFAQGYGPRPRIATTLPRHQFSPTLFYHHPDRIFLKLKVPIINESVPAGMVLYAYHPILPTGQFVDQTLIREPVVVHVHQSQCAYHWQRATEK